MTGVCQRSEQIAEPAWGGVRQPCSLAVALTRREQVVASRCLDSSELERLTCVPRLLSAGHGNRRLWGSGRQPLKPLFCGEEETVPETPVTSSGHRVTF